MLGAQWGSFAFFRMDNISDIYFVGGFGTVQWVDVCDYVAAQPDDIVSRTSDISPEEVLAVCALGPNLRTGLCKKRRQKFIFFSNPAST